MSWVFPRDPIVQSDVLDADVINHAIALYHSEVSGELNEHNFTEHALEDAVDPPIPSPPDHVEMDFACTIHHTFNEGDPYSGPFWTLKKTSSWFPVHGSTLEFDTSGGNVHIVASWQAALSNADNTNPGLMYAFEVDGNVLPDALIGSGDLGNDLVSSNNFGADGSPSENAWANGPGLANRKHGPVLELITYMQPGRHVVRLMSKWLRVGADTTQAATSTQCEIYAIDMRDL